MSFGSLMRSQTMPLHVRKMFLKAFSKLPQRVLWKWEADELADKPDNVMIKKWMPQRDILGKCISSSAEFVYCSVKLHRSCVNLLATMISTLTIYHKLRIMF